MFDLSCLFFLLVGFVNVRHVFLVLAVSLQEQLERLRRERIQQERLRDEIIKQLRHVHQRITHRRKEGM